MTLYYRFPVIRTVNDVLPAIGGRPEFIVVKKDYGITVINYTHQDSSTFPPVIDETTAILRECRGLVFDTASGRILNRRFHKFFNFGEKDDSTIDVSREHHLLDKLDGSMVSPCHIGCGIRWISKMGITDVSMQAEIYAADKPEYLRLAERCLGQGYTPIFEWLSRQQRIVLDYGKEDQLVLLAIRHNVSGGYQTRQTVREIGESYGIPVVKDVQTATDNIEEFIERTRQHENTEGVVVTFADGHMVKVKTDWYVQLHRAKDKITRERHLIRLILEDKLDDLLPVLPPDDRERVEVFASAIHHDILVFSDAVHTVMKMVKQEEWDRKSFALRSENLYHPPIRAACFALWGLPEERVKGLTYDWAKGFILKNLGDTALERTRQILQTSRWNEKTE